jgi:large subunit ribosomal protein L23
MHKVIVKPIITEKSIKEAEAGKFTFVVDKKANKHEIATAIEALFNVTVTGVATNTVKGVRMRQTRIGKRVTDESYKKARVMLAKDQKIDIFEIGKDK